MQRYDLTAFETFMQELAECYDRKPYGGAAIKHWFEALTEFSWDKVRPRLVLWRDTKTKPPMIGDIIPLLRDAVSDDVERRAVADKAAFSRAPTPVTRIGTAAMGTIREMLRNPLKPGKWWAYELRDKHRSGGSLKYVQLEMAKRACGPDWDTDTPYAGAGQVERVPGEDDE